MVKFLQLCCVFRMLVIKHWAQIPEQLTVKNFPKLFTLQFSYPSAVDCFFKPLSLYLQGHYKSGHNAHSIIGTAFCSLPFIVSISQYSVHFILVSVLIFRVGWERFFHPRQVWASLPFNLSHTPKANNLFPQWPEESEL